MADLDDYLRYLADRRRRELLDHLVELDATTVDDLAGSLSRSRPGAAPLRSGSADELSAELRHHHLPKLDDLSVVDYDCRTGTVDVLGVPPELRTLLDLTLELESDD